MRDQAERLRELVNSKNHRANSRKARIIAVTSGKGGVGKTNLSVNLSICLSKLGQKVTLIDTDLGLANIDLMLGMIPKYHLGHFFSGERDLADVVMEGPAGVRIIAGGSGLQELANIDSWQLDNCIERLFTLDEDNDFIILDTGAGISSKVIRFLLAAEEIIVVTIPEPTSIADAYGVIKILSKKTPMPRSMWRLIWSKVMRKASRWWNASVSSPRSFYNFRWNPWGIFIMTIMFQKRLNSNNHLW